MRTLEYVIITIAWKLVFLLALAEILGAIGAAACAVWQFASVGEEGLIPAGLLLVVTAVLLLSARSPLRRYRSRTVFPKP